MKFFSYYLPQFHEIPENDEWWGKGFTEWVNVKKAEPLYPGHIQPKHPLNNDYYNLLDKETVKRQTGLMKEFGLYGMIYYHYYFKGKLLLEKPAENLLSWKDIQQPFFFCWANHDWNRSWEGKTEVLVKQEYGGMDDWEKHFQYLLPFFQDERYEKKNNMPLFLLFKCGFSEKDEMFAYFDKRCKDYGFDGIFLIETFEGSRGKGGLTGSFANFKEKCAHVTKAVHTREPVTASLAYSYYIFNDLIQIINRRLHYEIGRLVNQPYLYRFDGNKLYKKMINESARLDAIHGLFFEWDNSPRHKNRGYVINPPSKQLFVEYMDTIKHDEYVFVNAWNEWAEGMMLEPTEEYGYRYLEWISEWLKNNENH